MSKEEAKYIIKKHVKDVGLGGNKQLEVKKLIVNIAQEVGLTPVEVEKIVDLQFKIIKDTISNAKLNKIGGVKNFRIKYLGSFLYNKYLLKTYLNKLLLEGKLKEEEVEYEDVIELHHRLTSLIESGKLTKQEALCKLYRNEDTFE